MLVEMLSRHRKPRAGLAATCRPTCAPLRRVDVHIYLALLRLKIMQTYPRICKIRFKNGHCSSEVFTACTQTLVQFILQHPPQLFIEQEALNNLKFNIQLHIVRCYQIPQLNPKSITTCAPSHKRASHGTRCL
jgi:hypothetical protein